jgi:ethanolamine transporter EutH
MGKNVLIFGLIAGFISVAWFLGMIFLGEECIGMENGMLYGYLIMLLAFSMIVVAVKNYRDKHLNGFISFGKAFKMGFLISLVASSVYVLVWLCYYYGSDSDFIEQYSAYMIEELRKSGESQAVIDQQIKEMADFSKMYENPFFNAMVTYMEILPVGLLVSLITALVMMKRKPKGTPDRQDQIPDATISQGE